jgi:hypothetical protein
MKRSIKNTLIVTTLLLFVVAFTAFNIFAGVILVGMWGFTNLVYDVAAKDFERKEVKHVER